MRLLVTLPVRAIEDDLALRLLIADAAEDLGVLAADAAEERGQAPVIVLAPFFIRMMMALGAGDAQAEEHLGGVIDELLRVLQFLVPHRRRGLRFVAGRGQDFADELIVRLVLGDRFANPAVEREGARRRDRAACAA